MSRNPKQALCEKELASENLSVKDLALFSKIHQFYFRVALSLSAIAALLSVSYQSDKVNIIDGSLILCILIYAYIAYWASHKNTFSTDRSLWFNNADGLMIGATVGLIHFSLLPSLLLAGIVQFNAITQGGYRHWLSAVSGTIIGMLLVYVFLSHHLVETNASQALSTATLTGAFAYLCIYGFCTYKHTLRLAEDTLKYHKESKFHKLHAYKLSRYLPSPVWDKMMGNQDNNQPTERKRITVFFSDIVGFSELTEEIESETLTELLNSYLTEMAKIAHQHNGTIDKFMGDAVMVMFGDNKKTSKGVKKDAIQCVCMALAMRKAMALLQKRWMQMGIKNPLQVRMGINTGYCTVGTFGTSSMLDYTALGTHVNLASRLETAGKPGDILLSFETWSLVKDAIMCRDKGQITVKGFSHPVQVYEVIAHRKELGSKQTYIESSADGFSILLDLDKIKNYDKDKVISTLEDAAKQLKNKPI